MYMYIYMYICSTLSCSALRIFQRFSEIFVGSSRGKPACRRSLLKTCLSIYLSLYIYLNIYVYLSIYIYLSLCSYLSLSLSTYLSLYLSLYIYICLCIYIYIYIYIYTYIYIYIYIYILPSAPGRVRQVRLVDPLAQRGRQLNP